MTQSTMFDVEDAYADASDHDRLRAFNADFTPRGMCRQIVELVSSRWAGNSGLRILDPSAGHGVYGSEWLRARPGDHVIGIEPRSECMDDLCANGYAEIYHGEFQNYAPSVGRVDITITNPPFELWEDILATCAKISEWVVFLGLSSWGHSQSGWPKITADGKRRSLKPNEQWRVSGRGKFRGETINPEKNKKYGADQRDVSHWVWIMTRKTKGWLCQDLPVLAPEDRTWTVPPGTEWRYQ